MNKNNFNYNTLSPFKWFVLENFPFIEADFDALTNWQLFCKLGNEINKIIKNVNELGGQVEEVKSAFIALQDYINNYFDNLDVQEEINNKLDEMATSGQLEEIIEQYLQVNSFKIFNTVQEMKNNENLIDGSLCNTLGFYQINDCGGAKYKVREITNQDIVDEKTIIALHDINLIAELLITDNMNVKQFGAKGDGIIDDSISIQIALTNCNKINVPIGDYLINNSLNMRFNTTLEGINPTNTKFIVGSNLTNSAIIKYGQSYDYSGKRGIIKNISIISNNNSGAGIGIVLYSGITIQNVTFNRLKVAINRSSSYIDNIELINCGIGYCTGTDDLYAINLSGNGDELKIDTLTVQSAYTASNFNEKCGIFIAKCTGGYLKNSVINAPLIIHSSKAFSVENSHFEGSQSDSFQGNKSFIELQNTNININNCYLHKRIDGGNIIISSSSNENTAGIVENNNTNIVINHNNIDILSDSFANYEIEKSTKTILKLSNVGIITDFSSSWVYTNELVGVRIKDLSSFNMNSSYYSINSIIGGDNRVLSPIPQLYDIYSNSNFLSYSSSNNKIPFYQQGFNNATQYIRGIIVFDETRKLAVKKSNEKSISGVTTGSTGILVNLSTNNSADISGKGLSLWYYRGDNENSYNRLTKIPIMLGQNCFDSGLFVSGCKTESRVAGDIDEFNYVKKCYKNGDNVIFYATSTPTVGTFTKGDKCINTNMTSGQHISWIYDGTNWISQGTY